MAKKNSSHSNQKFGQMAEMTIEQLIKIIIGVLVFVVVVVALFFFFKDYILDFLDGFTGGAIILGLT